VSKLVGSADDGCVGYTDREHGVDEVCEGRDAVHEDPEAREDGWGGEDTAEYQAEGEHQVCDVSARFGGLNRGDHHACEC